MTDMVFDDSASANHNIWLDLVPSTGSPDTVIQTHREVLNLLACHYPDAHMGQGGVCLSREQIGDFCEKLQANVDRDVYVHRVYFFRRLLEYGRNNLQWTVHLPSVPCLTRRPKNRYIPGQFRLVEVNLIAEAVVQDLHNPAPHTSITRYGQILLSAMLYGGMLNVPNLQVLVANLPSAWETSGHELAVPLKTSDGADRHDLWFADPVTQALIQRWWRDHQGDHSFGGEIRQPDQAIKAYLRHIGIGSTLSVAELRRQCQHWLALRVAPVLVDYGRGLVTSASLPQATWQRLITGLALNRQPSVSATVGAPMPAIPATVFSGHPSDLDKSNQIGYWRELQRKLGTHAKSGKHATFKAEIESYLLQHAEKLLPSLNYILRWGIDLVSAIKTHDLIYYPKREKGQLRPTSALSYMAEVAIYLTTSAADEDLVTMDAEELHDLYADAIALCPRSPKAHPHDLIAQRCAEALQRFHGFLQYRFCAPPVDFDDLVSSQKGRIAVDANVVSYTEYERLQQVLLPGQTGNALQKMRSLIAMLAFRCGLRRGECLRLRLCDFHPGSLPELLVRNSRYGRTKSSSSVRRLPLQALLTDDQLQSLKDWVDFRASVVGSTSSEALMFDVPGPLGAEKALMTPIRMALHQVTGDTTLRFHHLRHSFATWTLVRLMIPDLPELRAPFAQHPDFGLNACQNLRKQLLHNRSAGRQLLYELARLVGHESPETTLKHYVHLLDWILGQSLTAEHCEPQVSAAAISSLTGLSLTQIYYQNRSGSSFENEPGEFRLSRYVSRSSRLPHPYVYSLRKPLLTPLADQVSVQLRDYAQLYEAIPRALAALATNRPVAGMAKSLNLSVTTFHQWYKVASWIRTLKTADNIPRHLNVATATKGLAVFPSPCKTNAEKTMEKKVFFHGCKLAKSDKENLMEFMLYFLRNYQISHKAIRYGSDAELKKAVETVRLLGIKKEELIVSVDYLDTNVFNAAKKIRDLNNDLGKSATVVQGKSSSEKSKKMRFDMKVIDPDDKRTDPKNGTYYANYGFRLAIYLLAILMLTDQDLVP
ncbi:tyrosine-type recombinase/integrase [Desulfuromonas thiophila]|uniref:tyrosine-type recombinase/integrase n=1 Tax=Desulfuromonas thiophila TaxID=57664 RepID=UPI0024A83BA2|nr:tyrosine-type recombinase/integrase [Desulfuromonas thiophila]